MKLELVNYPLSIYAGHANGLFSHKMAAPDSIYF